jgi:hypothetical protein
MIQKLNVALAKNTCPLCPKCPDNEKYRYKKNLAIKNKGQHIKEPVSQLSQNLVEKKILHFC